MGTFLGLLGLEKLLVLLRQQGGLRLLLPLKFYLALKIIKLLLSSQSGKLLVALCYGQGLRSDDRGAG